jgi:Asp/Glu/hydantoin racemase
MPDQVRHDNKRMRIALIHATALSMAPIDAAFERHWPEAERMHLLDDSLSRDREREGELTHAMVDRFIDLATYAKGTGADAILFTCSAFGPAIEAAGRSVEIPTFKPNEAMFYEALRIGRKLALVATFRPSLVTMADELETMAQGADVEGVQLKTVFVPGAMADSAGGRPEDHDRKIAEAAAQLKGFDCVMLAQFSMARAAPLVQKGLDCPVLTSPGCAVLALRQVLEQAPDS